MLKIKFSSKLFGFLANVTSAERVEVRFVPRQKEDIDEYDIEVRIINSANFKLVGFKTVVIDGEYTKFKDQRCKLTGGRKVERLLFNSIRNNQKLLDMIKEHKKSLYDKGKK